MRLRACYFTLIACAAATWNVAFAGAIGSGNGHFSGMGAIGNTESYTVLNAGSIEYTPKLELQFIQDSNIYSSESAPQSSLIKVITPSFLFQTDNGINQSRLFYRGSKGIYDSSSQDDYFDHLAGANIHHEFLRYAFMNLDAAYRLNHEERGTAYSQGLQDALDSPDQYQTVSTGMLFTLGTRQSSGKIETGVNGKDIRYLTRQDVTAVRDRVQFQGRLAYHFNLSAKTSLLAETRYHVIEYASPLANLDSTEQRHFVGASWEFSALTKGAVRVGTQSKSFSDPSRQTASGLSWAIDIDWAPSALTLVSIRSAGRTEESTGFGDYIDSKSLALGIKHKITKLMELGFDSNATLNSYEPTSVREGVVALQAQVKYAMLRWMSLGLYANHTRRESSQSGLDFSRNRYGFSIQTSF